MTTLKVTQPHRWKNSMADVYTAKNGLVALDFLEAVIRPTFAALHARIEQLRVESETDVAADFAIADMTDLVFETGRALCLSVQSIWERQLRRYIEGCVDVLDEQDRAAHVAMARNTQWKTVEDAFYRVRGIQLRQMPGYGELSLLHKLGNVCRHGPGKSMEELSKSHPELWPSSAPWGFSGNGPVVSIDLLETFCKAIETFWEEAEYIYCESIVRKAASLEKRLLLERAQRAAASQSAKSGVEVAPKRP